MSKFTDRLIEVQESVAAARAQKVTQVAQAKAAILNRQPNLNNGYTVANLDDAKQGSGPLSQTMQFQSNGPTSVNPNVFEQSSSQAISPNVFENARIERSPEIYAPDISKDMERSVSSPLSPTAPVVGYTREGAEIRADGTHTVIDADGQQHTGLSEDDADRFQAFSRGKEEAKQSGAYESSLPTRLGGALQGGVDFILKESVNVTGPITLTDKLMQHNEATKSHLATIGAGHVAISEEDRLKYEALQKSGKEDPEFMSSYAGKQLAVLDTESKENKELYNKFEGWAKQLKDTIPIDRKDQYAARAAYLTIAKNEGNLSAMINTAKAGDI